jgi:AsmA-like C-terminal region
MKLLLKIGKIFAVLILTVSIALISAAFLLKDKVGFIILKSLNKNLSTKVDVGSYRLSFLRKFPKASLELKNVLVHSSPGFNSSEFKGINTDTLLSARSVSVEFRITDILKGIYTIQRIGAMTGKANFFTDTTGHVNYNISVKNNHPGREETTINLDRINLSDINAYYNNLEAHLIINGTVKSGRLKSRISGNNIDFTSGSEMQINHFQLYNFVINKPVGTKLDLILQSSKSGIKFKKGTLYIDNYDVGIDGFVSADNILDLNLTGHNLDISRIRKWLPEKNLRFLDDYDPSGIIIFSSKIKGLLSRKSNPHIEIEWQLRNGRIASKKSNLTLKDLSFDGHYSNGTANRSETSSLSIEGFKAKLGSSECTGSATLKEFNDPLIDLSLKGRVFPGEMKEFFNLKNISTAEGSVDLDLKVDNAKWPAKSFSIDRLIDLKPQGSLTFNSVTLGLQNNKTLINKINGNVMILNSIKANKIKFNYKGQNVRVDGEFKNLVEWLAGRGVTMSAKADISFDKLIPETFFKDDDVSGKNGRSQKAVTLPKDIVLDIYFHIDSLYYKTFSSSKIEGSLSYQPKTFIFKSLKMKSLDGLISGNCFFAQNSNKSILSRGSFIVTNIDVNKAFTTFHNFGQSFLKAENIKGHLSGSLSLLLPLDSVLNYNIKSLTAEGNYHLVNGALINFDPVKQLSSFIELSELENINFQQLDNDFFIKNNWLYVPQMEVKSSAADLSVNGKHSFDNDYEYHVKIRLSEILSRKRNKNKSNVTQFGVVEDDGLGHTSLLLKIIGKGETAKVGYDLKAAGAEVKKSYKKEKNTLKTILNQEYGWYKSDSTLNQKPPEKKSRFRIKWEDEDTVKNAPDTSSIKNIFKKK